MVLLKKVQQRRLRRLFQQRRLHRLFQHQIKAFALGAVLVSHIYLYIYIEREMVTLANYVSYIKAIDRQSNLT